MDLITHAVIGGLTGCALLPKHSAHTTLAPVPKHTTRAVMLAGALAGLLPDVDAFIQRGSDPLLVLDYHRHFTHALAFIPVGALVATLLLRPLVKQQLSFSRHYLIATLAYLFHLLLDACTSYGTHLWLPFSQEKVAWNLIAVVDPVFTLALLIPLLFFWRQPHRWLIGLSVVLATSYLSLSAWQQARVDNSIIAIAQQRGHQASDITVKPTMGNVLLWRSVYVHAGTVYADAFHAGRAVRHYPGQSAVIVTPAQADAIAQGVARRAKDIERFRGFSDGLIVLDPVHEGLIGDARYAMLPTAIAPIWGIRWTGESSGEGEVTEFISHHEFTPVMRKAFIAMLLGRDA
jgi:inner membrane protein